MTDSKQFDHPLQQLLWSVAEIGQLLAQNEPQAQYAKVLQLLGQSLHIDRVYLDHYHPDPSGQGVRVSREAEWCAEGVRSGWGHPDLENRLPYQPFYQQLLQGEVLSLTHASMPEVLRHHWSMSKVQSLLEVPVFVGEGLWGFVGFNATQAPREWSNEEINVLKATAHSLGKTLWRDQIQQSLQQSQAQNQALQHQSRRETDKLEMLLKLSLALANDLELQPMLAEVAQTVAQTFGYELVSIYTRQGPELALQHQVGYNFWLERVPPDVGLMHRCVQTGEAILVTDVSQNPEFIALELDIRSAIVVPLRMEGSVVGVMSVESRDLNFTTQDLELLQGVAAQVNVAMERVNAHLRLSEQEALQRAALDNLPECVTLLDGQNIIYTNPASCLVFGAQNVGELVGQPIDRFLLSAEGHFDKLKLVIEQGHSIPLTETHIVNLKGQRVDIELALSPVTLSHRQVAMATWHDIRRRKQIEASLQQSQDRYRSLVEASPDGIVEISPSGEILYANSSFMRLIGAYLPTEVLGQNVLDFVHSDSKDKAQSFSEIFHQGGTVPVHEEFWQRLDGRRVGVEVGTAPIAGTSDRMMAIVRDISQNQAAEEALRESENRFRTAVEVSPDGVLLIEPEFGRILYANPSYLRLVGAQRTDQVVGQLLWRFVHPEFQNLVADRILQLAQGGMSVPLVEQKHLRLDGSVVEVEAIGSRVQINNNSVILTNIRDIRERKQAENAIRASEARFKALFQNSLDMTLILDPSGQIIYASPNAVRINRTSKGDPVGNVFEFIGSEKSGAQNLFMQCLTSPREIFHSEINAPLENGEDCWYEIWIQNLLDEPAVGGIVLNLRDISERKAYQSTIEYLAYHDALTGLPNRRMLREQAEQSLALTQRKDNQATLIYLDLDRFKEVNDTLGHESGDELLVQVAKRIGQCVRAGDLLARLGGDEFAILLQDTTPQIATDVADRILRVLKEPFAVEDTQLRVGASLGLGVFPRDAQNLEELMRVADVAMYRAKENSFGYVFYSPELDRYSRERLNLLHDLRSGLENGEFFLEYQPILDTHTGAWSKLEALARWKHPIRGVIPPKDFIPLAEETGLIRELDRLVLAKACVEAVSFKVSVSVNISARTLYDPDFVKIVEEALQQSGLEAQRLHLEITETALIQDLPRAIKHLSALRALGVQMALDDFGVGNTSMGYLKHLPIDIIKIDRSFVNGIGRDSREEAILNTILLLGEGLGLNTVAEGVETQEQMQWLTDRGCYLLQGFIIAKPQAKELLLSGQDPASGN